jgi:hypothetical protein
MTIQLYDTHELMGVIRTIKPVNTFWLDLCFPRAQTFDSEFIDFDVLDRGRRLAPFVAPTVGGKVMRQQGFTTKRFTPAYIKPKFVVDPRRTIKRLAGEAYTGTLSPQARRDAIVRELLQEGTDMITRRMEWMAANAIINGTIVVSSPDYPAVTVDFGRAANQTIALAGAQQWGQAGVNPVTSLELWAERVAESSGFLPTEVVMGMNAWRVFAADQNVRNSLNNDFRGGSASLDVFEPRPLTPANPWAMRGTLGAFRIWTYNDLWENDAGVVQPLLDPNNVVMVSPGGVEGVRAYGAILDPHNNYAATEVFARNWIDNDPAAEFLMMQSAPLTVVARPNASLTARVLV